MGSKFIQITVTIDAEGLESFYALDDDSTVWLWHSSADVDYPAQWETFLPAPEAFNRAG